MCQNFREKVLVISVTRGWMGVQFSGKKHYVTLEWPPTLHILNVYFDKTHQHQFLCTFEEMGEEAVIQEEVIRNRVREEYDDLVNNLFSAGYELKQQFDQFR